jgi:hypothetical protein
MPRRIQQSGRMCRGRYPELTRLLDCLTGMAESRHARQPIPNLTAD